MTDASDDDDLKMLEVEISRLLAEYNLLGSRAARDEKEKIQRTLARSTLLQQLEAACHRKTELLEPIRIVQLRHDAVKSGLVESPTIRLTNLGECPLCLEEVSIPQSGSGCLTPCYGCCGAFCCAQCTEQRNQQVAVSQAALEKAAREGNAAQFQRLRVEREILDRCPFCRGNLPRDEEEKFQMLLVHAKAGRVWAQAEIARRMHGRNDPAWLHWFTKAAESGDHGSMAALAAAWQKGIVVPQSDEKAWEYAQITARQGNPQSQYVCGLVKVDRGGELDEAMQWFSLAASQGESGAQFRLGVMFKALKSPLLAYYWAKKGALQNCPMARVLLSELVTEVAELVSMGNTNDCGYCPLPEAYFWSISATEPFAASGRLPLADGVDRTVRDACVTCQMKQSTTVTIQRCAQCHVFGYCSKKCQAIHWKKGHKLDCNRVKELKQTLQKHRVSTVSKEK
jgi:TPR repeat protein